MQQQRRHTRFLSSFAGETFSVSQHQNRAEDYFLALSREWECFGIRSGRFGKSQVCGNTILLSVKKV